MAGSAACRIAAAEAGTAIDISPVANLRLTVSWRKLLPVPLVVFTVFRYYMAVKVIVVRGVDMHHYHITG